MSYLSKLTKRLALALAVTAVACGAPDAGTSPEEPGPVGVAQVLTSPDSTDLSIGDNFSLVVQVRDSAGRNVSGQTITYSSSDPSIARVSADGQVTALATGSSYIDATVRTVRGRMRLRVRPVPVARVVVSPSSSSMAQGAQVALSAMTLSSADSLLLGRRVTWASNATNVVAVDSLGRVSGVAAGNATITASSEGITGTAQITVVAPPPPPPVAVARVAVSPATNNVAPGAQVTLAAVTYSASNVVLTGRRVTWASNATSIATVDSLGRVQAVAAGNAVVTATSEGINGTAQIAIVAPPPPPVAVSRVAVTPATNSLAPTAQVSLVATTYSASNVVLTGRRVTWASNATSIATVDTLGRVRAIAAGNAVITATSEGINGTAQISVVAPPPTPVARVVLSPTTLNLAPGDQLTINAVTRSAADAVLSGRRVTWVSNATSVATVDTLGRVRAVAVGSAVITATSEGITATAQVTVAEPPPPPPGSITFASDWSSATGTSTAALRDGGKWDNLYCQQAATTLTVIPGNTVGWSKTANVLRLQQLGPTACGTLEKVAAVPAGTTHWGRLYFRNDEVGSRHNHVATYNPGVGAPIQTSMWNRYGTSAGVNIFLRTYYTSSGAGTAYPTNLWSMGTSGRSTVDYLANGQWYRYEWMMEYVTPTTYRIWPRIYDMGGNLLYDATRFFQNDYPSTGTHSLASWYAAGNTFGFTDAALGRRFGLGNEGPAMSPNTGGYWYHADVAMSTAGWIGR